jgi:hypothetical protein
MSSPLSVSLHTMTNPAPAVAVPLPAATGLQAPMAIAVVSQDRPHSGLVADSSWKA